MNVYIWSLSFCLSVVTVLGQDWVNSYDKPADFQCPENQWISRIQSQHSNSAEDRQWAFGCTGSGDRTLSGCSWSGYGNHWQGQLLFLCNDMQVVAGIKSIHDNGEEDRRTQFQCCTMDDYLPTNCKVNAFANDWDKPMDFNVPSDSAIIGAFSYYSSNAHDRKWKYLTCVMSSTAEDAPPCTTQPPEACATCPACPQEECATCPSPPACPQEAFNANCPACPQEASNANCPACPQEASNSNCPACPQEASNANCPACPQEASNANCPPPPACPQEESNANCPACPQEASTGNCPACPQEASDANCPPPPACDNPQEASNTNCPPPPVCDNPLAGPDGRSDPTLLAIYQDYLDWVRRWYTPNKADFYKKK